MNFQVDPKQLIKMIREGQNPQQLMLAVLSGQVANTPIGANLLNLVKEGKTKEIEKIVRNLYAQSGGTNFDEDFKNFKSQWGLQ